MFIYQNRAFLDQVVGTPDPVPPNGSFAHGLHNMEIIEAIVRSAQSDGAPAAVATHA
jgi:predicted dehydrogenase